MNFQSYPSMNPNKRELINRIRAFRIISEFRFYAVWADFTSNLTLTNVCGYPKQLLIDRFAGKNESTKNPFKDMKYVVE